MYQDTRKQLRTVDISCYDKELAIFREKLSFRELASSTVRNYLSNLKIILAWVVMFLADFSVCSCCGAQLIQFPRGRPNR